MNANRAAEIRKELNEAGYTWGGKDDLIIVCDPTGESVAHGSIWDYKDMLAMAIGHLMMMEDFANENPGSDDLAGLEADSKDR